MREKNIITILLMIISFSLVFGCIENKEEGGDEDNNSDENSYLVIRIESITIINQTLDQNEIPIDLTIDSKNVTFYFDAESWQNEIHYTNTENGIYRFKVGINKTLNNDSSHYFVNSFDNIFGAIEYFDKTISLNIDPIFVSSCTIEENDLYLEKNAYNIITTGLDMYMNILIAIEHQPPD